MKSIFKTLDAWTQKQPEKLLFSFLNVGGREIQRYSYQAFFERTHTIARHLHAQHRFCHNDRVLLAYPPGLEMICAFFGSVRAGLIPVPVYPPGPSSFKSALYRMAHIAKDCEAAGVLTARAHKDSVANNLAKNGTAGSADSVAALRLPWISTDDLLECPGESTFRHGDILFIQYTSGSTSHPKGVIVTHENVLHNCPLAVGHLFPVGVSWLPQCHDMGLIGYYLFSALAGGSTYGFSPFDFIQRPALWFTSIKKYEATITSAPNFALDYCMRPGRLSEEVLKDVDLSSLRSLMAAAEPVSVETYLRFLRTFQPYGLRPKAFFVAYGLAENTLVVSSYGRNILSVNKKAFAVRRVRTTSEVSAIAVAKQILSCGRPLGDVIIRIVDPEKHVALKDEEIGEIWVAGKSKCSGYWNNAELTQATFRARIVGDTLHAVDYLRTGDMGFLHDGELYICGRIKDMIIIRGQNYYPQDVEQIVEEASGLLRKGCVVAFEINENEPALAVVAEVKSREVLPDAQEIIAAIRNHLSIEVACIAFVPPKSISKTSSGKLMRPQTKQMWLEGRFKVLSQFTKENMRPYPCDASASPFEALKTRYKLTGDESCSLTEAGIDSLDLVIFMSETQEWLKEKGADTLANEVDFRLIQRITVAELCRLGDLFECSPESAVFYLRGALGGLLEEHRRTEEQLMLCDRTLGFHPPANTILRQESKSGAILLTGGTGFVGPFLLKNLLLQTSDDIYVLIRARDEAHGRNRLREAVESIGPLASDLRDSLERRLIPVCGTLEQANLGLSAAQWKFLSEHIHTIFHNGAEVNYLFSYSKLRATNVNGTKELLRLAFDRHPKIFNYISTTFIFGWAVKEVLYERDCNTHMELLDFGYSQSKWVAEQLVLEAMLRKLPTRIFRPALVSPSVSGKGSSPDIALRLLAFMVNHGIGVDALNQVSFVPADVATANIVGISNVPETVNKIFHVARDEYANMVNITDIITKLTGQQFEMFSIRAFVPEVIKRCTRNDPLFPLLDFLVSSIDNIASMEFKRYDSAEYQKARAMAQQEVTDPSLEDTVLGILRFMKQRKLISVPVAEQDILDSIFTAVRRPPRVLFATDTGHS